MIDFVVAVEPKFNKSKGKQENNMKCSKCGNEYDGNFCPQCGKPADMEEDSAEGKTTRNAARNTNAYVTSIAGVIVDAILTALLLHYKVSVLLIGALWIAVLLDIILEKKNQKVAHRIVTVISTLMILVTFYEAYSGYQDKKYIDVVQEQEYMGISYEKLFEHFSKDIEWECTEQGRFTSIDTNESARSGSYEAVVIISGGCYVYNEETTYQIKFDVSKEENRTVATELILDGTSYSSTDEIERFLNSVYRDYVGNDNPVDAIDDDSVSQSNTLPEKEQTIAYGEEASLETDSDVWFVTYNSFYRTRDIGGIEINVMNDAVMFVQCTGSDGTVAEWEMNLKPAEMGDDGEYIYYYGKGIKMSYYPSDHHIHVDAEDNYFGDYYPNE